MRFVTAELTIKVRLICKTYDDLKQATETHLDSIKISQLDSVSYTLINHKEIEVEL